MIMREYWNILHITHMWTPKPPCLTTSFLRVIYVDSALATLSHDFSRSTWIMPPREVFIIVYLSCILSFPCPPHLPFRHLGRLSILPYNSINWISRNMIMLSLAARVTKTNDAINHADHRGPANIIPSSRINTNVSIVFPLLFSLSRRDL